jgi:hypothetical protein
MLGAAEIVKEIRDSAVVNKSFTANRIVWRMNKGLRSFDTRSEQESEACESTNVIDFRSDDPGFECSDDVDRSIVALIVDGGSLSSVSKRLRMPRRDIEFRVKRMVGLGAVKC